jgi:hypothetical protein
MNDAIDLRLQNLLWFLWLGGDCGCIIDSDGGMIT